MRVMSEAINKITDGRKFYYNVELDGHYLGAFRHSKVAYAVGRELESAVGEGDYARILELVERHDKQITFGSSLGLDIQS